MSGAGRTTLDERLVVELGTAFHQRAVYPTGHPQVRRAIERAHQALTDWLAGTGAEEVSLLVVEEQFVVDRTPLPEEALWRKGLWQAMAKHGLGGLTLRAGLTVDELGRFLDSCFSPGGPESSRHLHHGRARIREGAGGGGESGAGAKGEPGAGDGRGGDGGGAAGLSAEEMAGAAEELRALARGGLSRTERLRGMIARLARSASTARDAPAALSAAAIADPSLRHGLETALGSLRLGRALGVSADVLEELGLAGLLYDVGYLEPAGAGESFDERRRQHPVRGALRLAAMEGLPESVVLAAYEHHLRWDSAENYPRLSAPRRPAAPARVVAVADTWSTLRGPGGATPAEAAAILRDRAGGFLDPDLVEAFLAGLV